MKNKVKIVWSDLYETIIINDKTVYSGDELGTIHCLKLLAKHNVIELDEEETENDEYVLNYE